MSKTKSDLIPHYELLYLIANKYSEDEVKPIVEKVNSLIAANNGKITLNEDLGKKRLAYPIKGFRYGYYNLAEFDMPGISLSGLDRALRLLNEVLRQQIVLKPIKTAEQIAKDRKISEKIAAKNLEEEKSARDKAKEQDKDKVDLKDLDEKLDKILETDSLL